MKSLSLFFLGALLLTLTGCDTVRTKVQTRFAEPVYQVKVVDVDPRKAYDAAKAALAKISFTVERGGGPAQGKLTAIGRLHPSTSAPGTARQLLFKAKIAPALEGGSKIEVLFSEMVEDDFNKRPGQGEVTPLHDSSIYEVYFRYIDEVLAAKP